MTKSFFYAEDEPEIYDVTAPLTERTYDLGHDALQLVLEQHLRLVDSRRAGSIPVLDLGCGTGKECLPLLSASRRVHLTAVDVSAPMLAQLARKLELAFGSELASDRTRLVECDFSNDEWIDVVNGQAECPGEFEIVVAAHSLHHLSSDQKRILYTQIHSLLSADGVCVILDLFDYFDEDLSQLAKRNIVDWLGTQMSSESIAAAHAGLFPLERRSQLRKSWIHHIEHENHPLPLLAVPSEAGDGRESEVDILIGVGFRKVEIPFRWFQSGLILASKRL